MGPSRQATRNVRASWNPSARWRSHSARVRNSDFDFRHVLRGSNAFFYERVPVVAVRALPQKFRAAVAAAHADMWIKVEDGMLGELAVPIHERRWMVHPAERTPDRLVDTERVWILNERGEEQVECVL